MERKMSETTGSVVLYNCITLLLVGGLAWLCGTYFNMSILNIVNNPLHATENIICALVVWQIIGLYAVQGFYKINFKNVVLGLVVNGLCAPLFHVSLIAFGAPLTRTVRETFHLALLLMTLTTLPCSLTLGLSTTNWCRLFLLNTADCTPTERKVWSSSVEQYGPLERSVWWCSLGSVVGVWLGAVPIPLDWDRPWQVWPISCVIGVLIGYCCGAVCGIVDAGLKSVEKKIKDV